MELALKLPHARMPGAAGRRSDENGGFPVPPPGAPTRVARCTHAACGAETRVQLPAVLPLRAVRRVVCDGCNQAYDCHDVEAVGHLGLAGARERAGSLLRRPPGRGWAWASIPIAALAVIGILALVQGGGEETPVETAAPGAGAGAGAVPDSARLVRQPNFSLAIPPGWERTNPPSGASFSAPAADGGADATLWIERDRNLSMREFEAQSLAQLREVAGSARVAERITAPSQAGTVIRLRADAPAGELGTIPYEVTLRAAGPFRYYLATSIQPDASRQARRGAELVHGSFIPDAKPDKKG